MEAKSSMQVIILCMKNALTGSNGIMHKKMNAPEGQTLQRDIKLLMKERVAARLYLNLLKCYSKFNSFFSFPVFLS
jgi:hypothetical protein